MPVAITAPSLAFGDEVHEVGPHAGGDRLAGPSRPIATPPTVPALSPWKSGCGEPDESAVDGANIARRDRAASREVDANRSQGPAAVGE